jgi:hypothetical protein
MEPLVFSLVSGPVVCTNDVAYNRFIPSSEVK